MFFLGRVSYVFLCIGYVLFFFILLISNLVGLTDHRSTQGTVNLILALDLLFVFCGYLLFKWLPNRTRKLIRKQILPFSNNGFSAKWQVFDWFYHNYLGVDTNKKQVLYIKNSQATLMDFTQIINWQIEFDGQSTTKIKLFTSDFNLPVLTINIPNKDHDVYHSYLMNTFGR